MRGGVDLIKNKLSNILFNPSFSSYFSIYCFYNFIYFDTGSINLKLIIYKVLLCLQREFLYFLLLAWENQLFFFNSNKLGHVYWQFVFFYCHQMALEYKKLQTFCLSLSLSLCHFD